MSTSIQTLPLSTGRLWTARLLERTRRSVPAVRRHHQGVQGEPRPRGLQSPGPAGRPGAGDRGLVLVCAIVYAIPRSAILGAILITGLLGGAVATHVRAGSPAFEAFMFPVIMGALAWIPLWLRDVRVRALL